MYELLPDWGLYIMVLKQTKNTLHDYSEYVFFSGFKATSIYEECLHENNVTIHTTGDNSSLRTCDFKKFISEVSI